MIMQHVEKRKALIVTALEVEFKAVIAYLNNSQEETHPKGTIYERGEFTTDNTNWSILVAQVDAGNVRAALEAERAIEFFTPQVAIFVGVAGGVKDVSLGDVVVSDKIYGYESGASKQSFEPRPEVGRSTYAILQRAKSIVRKGHWKDRIIQDETHSTKTLPKAFVGSIAAGEKVVKSKRAEVYKFIKTQYGDTLAVEMEGKGFLEAAYANQQVEAIVVRGISDLIEKKEKSDAEGSQERASQNASALAFQILAEFNIPIPENSNLESREDARKKLSLILLENKTIFENYGPMTDERFNPESTLPIQWLRKVKTTIIPNNQKILSICDSNVAYLSDEEREVLELFRQHVDDFEAKHLEDTEINGLQFPSEVYNLFT